MSWAAPAREIGMGLVALGYQPAEVVSILSNTNREWMCADLGALGAAGVVSGIYPTDAASQVEYLLADFRLGVRLRRGRESTDKILEGARESARTAQDHRVRHGRASRPERSADHQPEALRALGASTTPRIRENGSGASTSASPRIWQSSSTPPAPPQAKGAMISHQNIVVTCEGYKAGFPHATATSAWRSCRYATSPSASAGSTTRSFGPVLNFVENPETVPRTCARSRPPSSRRCRASGKSSIRAC
jgi:long-chain acyl-CoA synthetase